MVAGCLITEKCTLAASADRVWKVAFARDGHDGDRAAALPRACAGFVDAVEVDGDGGPGSVTTVRLKLNPAVEGATTTVMRSRLVSRTRRRGEGGEDGGAGGRRGEARGRRPNQARLTGGYLGLLKMVEAYLVAHPDEYN